jgi:hypothetical protein
MDNVRLSRSLIPPLTTYEVESMDADIGSLLDRLQLTGPDMLIDGYDQYNQQDNEVVNISPDDASEEPSDVLPRADDCIDPCPQSQLRLY